MTAFFAVPDETDEWLRSETDRLGLAAHDSPLRAGGRRYFVWPRDAPPLPSAESGVLVTFPTVLGNVLVEGDTGWRAAAFDGETAAAGRRLLRSLTQSLRKRVTVPLFAQSGDGASVSERARAWATPAALASGLELRPVRDSTVRYVTGGGR